MDHFIELLKITIPALAVFAATYFIVKKFLDNEQKKREYEIRKSTQGNITPIRLQAFERIVIFLERIHPNSLVIRVDKSGLNSHSFQMELIRTVKAEYEHNLSQQIYMSSASWSLVKNAKEETIKMVNLCAAKLPESAKAQDLAAMILQLSSGMEKMPGDVALDYIKKEIARSF